MTRTEALNRVERRIREANGRFNRDATPWASRRHHDDVRAAWAEFETTMKAIKETGR